MMIDGEDDEVEIELDDGDIEHAAKPEGEEGAAGENDDELVVEIEGIDDAPAEETPVIRSLRQRERELARRVKELESQQQTAVETEVGPEPDLWEDCDGDPETYKTKLMAWNQRKVDAETRQFKQQQAEQVARERFDTSVQTMRANAVKMGVPGYQEAEEAVGAALPQVIGNAIPIYFGERAPVLVKALHSHPQLLAKIVETSKTDIVQALFDLHDLSKGVKMVPKRKTGAQAEEILRGSAPLSGGGSDKQLDKLEKEAERNGGDRSAVIAYKASLRKKAA